MFIQWQKTWGQAHVGPQALRGSLQTTDRLRTFSRAAGERVCLCIINGVIRDRRARAVLPRAVRAVLVSSNTLLGSIRAMPYTRTLGKYDCLFSNSCTLRSSRALHFARVRIDTISEPPIFARRPSASSVATL